jgi:hypothetical protein
MLYLIVKAALSGVIAAASEIARRSPGFGALAAALRRGCGLTIGLDLATTWATPKAGLDL